MSDCIYAQLGLPALQNVSYASRADVRSVELVGISPVKQGRFVRSFEVAIFSSPHAVAVIESEHALCVMNPNCLGRILTLFPRTNVPYQCTT